MRAGVTAGRVSLIEQGSLDVGWRRAVLIAGCKALWGRVGSSV